jgi:hypothetical protein
LPRRVRWPSLATNPSAGHDARSKRARNRRAPKTAEPGVDDDRYPLSSRVEPLRQFSTRSDPSQPVSPCRRRRCMRPREPLWPKGGTPGANGIGGRLNRATCSLLRAIAARLIAMKSKVCRTLCREATQRSSEASIRSRSRRRVSVWSNTRSPCLRRGPERARSSLMMGTP